MPKVTPVVSCSCLVGRHGLRIMDIEGDDADSLYLKVIPYLARELKSSYSKRIIPLHLVMVPVERSGARVAAYRSPCR